MLELLTERGEACATKSELRKICGRDFERAFADLNIRLDAVCAAVEGRKAKGFVLVDNR